MVLIIYQVAYYLGGQDIMEKICLENMPEEYFYSLN
jgi:hypothetical protein